MLNKSCKLLNICFNFLECKKYLIQFFFLKNKKIE